MDASEFGDLVDIQLVVMTVNKEAVTMITSVPVITTITTILHFRISTIILISICEASF